MDRVDITLNLRLPQDLAARAAAAGLLTEAQIERLLTVALTRQLPAEAGRSPSGRLSDIPESDWQALLGEIAALTDEDEAATDERWLDMLREAEEARLKDLYDPG